MILQYFLVFLIGIICEVLQSTLFRPLSRDLQIDLVFVMVVIIGLFKDPVHGSIWSAGLGLIEDILSGTMTGLFMTARITVFILAQTLRGRLSPDTPLSQFTIAIGLGVFDRLVVFLLFGMFSEPFHVSGAMLLHMALGTLINASLVPLFYFIFRLVPGFMEMPRGPMISE